MICRRPSKGDADSCNTKFVQIAIVLADGRICSFCGIKDTSADPVDAALGITNPQNGDPITCAWYLGHAKHGAKNEGKVCFYCYAVYQARYKQSMKTGVNGVIFRRELRRLWKRFCNLYSA